MSTTATEFVSTLSHADVVSFARWCAELSGAEDAYMAAETAYVYTDRATAQGWASYARDAAVVAASFVQW